MAFFPSISCVSMQPKEIIWKSNLEPSHSSLYTMCNKSFSLEAASMKNIPSLRKQDGKCIWKETPRYASKTHPKRAKTNIKLLTSKSIENIFYCLLFWSLRSSTTVVENLLKKSHFTNLVKSDFFDDYQTTVMITTHAWSSCQSCWSGQAAQCQLRLPPNGVPDNKESWSREVLIV